MPKDDGSLKRLGGGRWQTRDERFTIEGDGGRWTVVDTERTDDLGLPLVRGPFASLTDAKAAIETARDEPERASPLADRIAAAKTAPKARAGATSTGEGKGRSAPAERSDRGRSKDKDAADEAPAAPPPPAWLTKLAPEARTHAERLLAAAAELGLDDAEALVKRDVLDDEPAVARAILLRRLALVAREAAGDGADAAERQRVARVVGTVAEWLTNRGREPGPRLALPGWRLVEEGPSARRIEVTRAEVERAARGTSGDR